MTQEERNQVARVLRSYIAREFSNDISEREFFENLVESWRETGDAGTGSIDRDTFQELVEDALQ